MVFTATYGLDFATACSYSLKDTFRTLSCKYLLSDVEYPTEPIHQGS